MCIFENSRCRVLIVFLSTEFALHRMGSDSELASWVYRLIIFVFLSSSLIIWLRRFASSLCRQSKGLA